MCFRRPARFRRKLRPWTITSGVRIARYDVDREPCVKQRFYFVGPIASQYRVNLMTPGLCGFMELLTRFAAVAA
ncbi:MAG: hypothetical protein Ct9H300mP8_00220 [Gammaproteobacteria bacterium]|nr:MAG: hypothetical protein Ct9H300mP8_00220 [Gammaproteobacteria bacterium]